MYLFSDELVPAELSLELYAARGSEPAREALKQLAPDFLAIRRDTRDAKALTYFGDRKRSSYRPTRNR